MLALKNIKALFGCLALLVILITASGFTGTINNYQKPQTEQITTSRPNSHNHTAYYINTTPLKVTHNQYTIFSFKSLLSLQYFNFTVQFKSQRKAVMQFVNFNSILEQNLIAKTQSNITDKVTLK